MKFWEFSQVEVASVDYVMKFKEIVIFFILHFYAAKCQHLSLIGSHFIQTDTKYSLYLHSNNVPSNSNINVTLSGTGYADSKVINSFSDDGKERLDFEIPRVSHPEYTLQVFYKNTNRNICKKQSVKLVSMSKRPVILIQLNKATYKAEDEIRFRAFVLTQKLIPYTKIDQMNVLIIDSVGNMHQKYSNAKTSQYGVYENSVKIPKSPIFGKWKIEVEVDEKKRSKIFEVEKLKTDTIEVDIDTNKEISAEYNQTYLSLKVKHPTKNYFSGNAIVDVRGMYRKEGNRQLISCLKNVSINSITKTLEFDIIEDLKILNPDSDVDIAFDVKIISHDTTIKPFQKIVNVLVKKKIEKKGINFLRNKYFRPGIKFPIKIELNSIGQDVDSFFDSLEINLKYHKKTNFISKTHKIKVKKSIISTSILPPIGTVKIDVNIKFNDEILNDTLFVVPSHCDDEFMQAVFIDKGEGIGSVTKINVDTTNVFKTLHIIVVGPNGIITSNEFPDANNKKNFKFSLELTDMMGPRSNLIIYYIREDGVYIYDYIPLVFQASVDSSSMKVNTDATAKSDENVVINMEAPEGSKIFLSANDQSSKQANEIFESDVADEIFAYVNLKFNKSSPFDMHQIGAFVVQPMEGVFCNEISQNKDGSFIDEAEENIPKLEGFSSNYFADVWFQGNYLADGTNQIVAMQTPKISTTYRMFSIAIHPISGFSIAETQKEISVFDDILVKIKAPSEVALNEIFSIKYEIVNLKEVSFFVNVSIKLEKAILIESRKKYNDYTVHVGECLEFMEKSQSLNKEIYLHKNGLSNAQTFLVKSKEYGKMKIRIEVTAVNLKIISEESLIVKSSQLKKLKKTESLWIKNFPLLDVSTFSNGQNEMITYANLLGPALKNPNGIFEFDFDSKELKVSKLAASVIHYKFLKEYNITENEKTNSFNNIWMNFQEATSEIKSLLSSNKAADIKLVAYLAQVLVDVDEELKIGDSLIIKCLNFIKKHQKHGEGSFHASANDNLRNEIGNEKSKSNIIISLSYSAFSKSKSLKEEYRNQRINAINNLKEKWLETDYEKAIAAYAFALNNDNYYARNQLGSIRTSLLTMNDPKYSAMNVEVVSYIILTKIYLNMSPENEIKWLIQHRQLNGGFYSPLDTVLGLQALYEYNKYKKFETPRTGVKIDEQNTIEFYKVTDEKVIDVNKNMRIQPSGSGQEYLVVYHESNLNSEVQTNYFGMNHEIKVEEDILNLIIRFSLAKASIQNSKMIIVEIQLPKGCKYFEHTKSNYIENVEVKNNGNQVILQITGMEKLNNYNFAIKTKRAEQFYSSEENLIKVYEFDRPNLSYLLFYKYDINDEICKSDKEKDTMERKRQNEIQRIKEIERLRKLENIRLEQEAIREKKLEQQRRERKLIEQRLERDRLERERRARDEADRQRRRDQNARNEMDRYNRVENNRCNTGWCYMFCKCNKVNSYTKYSNFVRFYKKDGYYDINV